MTNIVFKIYFFLAGGIFEVMIIFFVCDCILFQRCYKHLQY